MTKSLSPTQITYESLNTAHEFFNERLFGGTLAPCMITLQRKKNYGGYFQHASFVLRNGQEIIDEIALNPSYFDEQAIEEILSNLVHEMAHQWQQQYGEPSRTGYHNKQWARKMHEVGLVPSDTRAPGGKEVGQKMSHYIADGGPFSVSCADLLRSGRFCLEYVETPTFRLHPSKSASKTKYTCPGCQMNAWAKPGARLICDYCHEYLLPPGVTRLDGLPEGFNWRDELCEPDEDGTEVASA